LEMRLGRSGLSEPFGPIDVSHKEEQHLEHWECHACKALTAEGTPNCWKCHLPRSESKTSTGVVPRSPNTDASRTRSTTGSGTPSKYPALETVSTLLNVVAVVVLILCLLGGVVLFAQIGGVGGIASGIALAVLGLLQWLFLRAAAESLIVLVDIERNTRLAAEASRARAG
jgi:hypothetical protein